MTKIIKLLKVDPIIPIHYSLYGNIDWVKKVVKDFRLEQTLRGVGRPRNGG